jgi:putative nucleotidyltransferase with HDIG domain
MEMLDHIITHSMQVCRVATFLADHLKKHNKNLNRDLIQASALLHDITKTRSFRTQEDHALTGSQLLTKLGYPEVGNLIGQHVRLRNYFAARVPLEAEIVNYADKRVLHDKVVNLQERMNYILEKYGKASAHRQLINRFWKKTEELEDKLFSFLPFLPEELNHLVNAKGFPDDLLGLPPRQ